MKFNIILTMGGGGNFTYLCKDFTMGVGGIMNYELGISCRLAPAESSPPFPLSKREGDSAQYCCVGDIKRILNWA